MNRKYTIIFAVSVVLGFAVAGAALNLAGSDGSAINNGVPLGAEDYNATIVVYGDTNASLDNFSTGSGVVEVVTEEGNLTMTAEGSTHVEVLNTAITGEQTKLTGISAGGTWITIDPEDKPAIDFRGDLDEIHFRDIDPTTRQEDVFISGPDGGIGTVRSSDFPANTNLKAVDIDTGEVLDLTTSDANGQATFDIPLSSHSVSFESFDNKAPIVENIEPSGTIRYNNTTLSADVSDPNFDDGDEVQVEFYLNGTLQHTENITSNQTVTDTVDNLAEGDHNITVVAEDYYGETTTTEQTFTVSFVAPTVANPDPTGFLNDTPDELSIDVSDGDFPLNGDSVDVTFSLDGTEIDTKTITSNGTVTTSNYGTVDLGDHTWSVEATDDYGNTVTESYDFTLPANITIRNETNASQIITGKNITATFYSANGEVVVKKTDDDNDGNISLRGLPNSEFVIVFEGDDYHDRRAYIESITQQQSFYLLNSTAYPLDTNEAIFTTFIYEDRTGNFPQSSSTLRVERAVDVNNDGEFEWETMAGDYWGAAGEFPFTGEYNERYRLVVKNQQTGDKRVLGTHIPIADGTKNIIIGRIIFEAENGTGRFYDAQINQNTSNLQVYYNDPTNKTTDLEITVYESGNKSNQIYTDTVSGPIGEYLATISLTDDQADTNWIVKFDGTHSTDGDVYGEIIVGGASVPLPLDPSILAAFSYAFVTFVMALYGPRTALLGAWAGIFSFAGLVFIGWIPANLAAITMAVVVAAGATFYSEAMP